MSYTPKAEACVAAAAAAAGGGSHPGAQKSTFETRLSSGIDRRDLALSRISAWYPLLRKVTMQTQLVPLPSAFVEYVNAEGPLVLPPCPPNMQLHPSDPRYEPAPPEFDETGYFDADSDDDGSWQREEPCRETGRKKQGDETGNVEGGVVVDDDDDGDDDDDDDDGDDDTTLPAAPEPFPLLENAIREALVELGGKAFCRSDWTSPGDARWVCGSLQVTAPGHVYLLWKSSDALCAEVADPFKYCEATQSQRDAAAPAADSALPQANGTDRAAVTPLPAAAQDTQSLTEPGVHVLALRRWVDLYPSNLFKCIVADKQLLAISQKDASTKFSHLAKQTDRFKELLSTFHRRRIASVYPGEHYVYDAYVDSQNRVSVIDFDPISRFADFGLYSAQDVDTLYQCRKRALHAGNDSDAFEVDFRLAGAVGIRPSSDMYHALPKDLLDRGLAASDDQSQKIQDTVREIMRQKQSIDEEEEEEHDENEDGEENPVGDEGWEEKVGE